MISLSVPLHRPEEQLVFTRSNYRSLLKLRANIFAFCAMHPLSHIAFLTFTFKERIFSSKEAMKQMNSFLSNHLRGMFKGYILVRDYHLDGAIHFHVLLLCAKDIARGSDLRGLSRASKDEDKRPFLSEVALQYLKEIESAAEKYKFGRIEFVPIYSNGEAVCRYLTKNARGAWTLGKKNGKRRTEDEFEELLGPKRWFYAKCWNEQGRVSVLTAVPGRLRAAVEESQQRARIIDPVTLLYCRLRKGLAERKNPERMVKRQLSRPANPARSD